MASMASVPAQSLECGICQELYNKPKQLSCSHTFCQKCLADLLDFNMKEDNLTCPVCRQTTQVEDGDVSNLQTNFPIKSLVEDVKAAKEICTICDHDIRSPAVVYCRTCGDFMCTTCLDIHRKWKKHRGHEVVDSDAIKSGKVKVKQMCKKHPQEEMEWVCSTCKVSICFRCRMLYHNGPHHEVEEVAELQKALKDEATTLQKEAEDTVQVIKDHIRVVEEENEKSSTILDERVADVIRAYDDSIENFTKQKDELVKKLQKCKQDMTGNLQDMKECDVKLLSGISSACDLVSKGVAGFLEGESLVVHQRLCTELRELMSRVDCNDEVPRGITERAESTKFTRYHSQNELKLGDLNLPGMGSEAASGNPPRALKTTPREKPWNLKKIGSLPTLGYGINDMSPAKPDGRMALCYERGGVDIFTIDGLHETILKKTKIKSLRFLSDGRCAVIESNKEFSMYSPKLEKVPSPECRLTNCYWVRVGKVNEILICHYHYEQKETLYSVYRPDRKEFVRGIKVPFPCSHETFLWHMNHRPYSIFHACSSHEVHVVSDVDGECQIINKVYVNASKVTLVLLDDDSILIGRLNDDGVTVNLYTHDLRYVKAVLQGFKLYVLKKNDFFMNVFSTGELAISDSRHVHVFRKCYEANEV